MKKLILLLTWITFTSNNLSAFVWPKGVRKLSTDSNQIHSFFYEDKSGRLWIGNGGGISNYFIRQSNGMGYIDANGDYVITHKTGIFTDATEYQNKVFFASYDGLYQYKNDTFTQQAIFGKISSLCVWKDELYIGTVGEGLKVWKDGHQILRPINLNSNSYDSILSLAASDNQLLIGTTKGLLIFENGTYSEHKLPIVANQRYEQYIRSIAVDDKHRIWCMNNLKLGNEPNVFVFEDGRFKNFFEFFGANCVHQNYYPFSCYKLMVSQNGSLLLGTSWGMLELTDKIRPFPISDHIFQYLPAVALNNTNIPCMAFERRNGKYYTDIYNMGTFEIDRSLYDMNSLRNDYIGERNHSFSAIEANDIEASVANDGILFNKNDVFGAILNQPGFRSSSSSCNDLIFQAGFWISAKNNSNKLFKNSVALYRMFKLNAYSSDFVPGPINIKSNLYDPELSKQYNKIWKIDRKTIDEFRSKRLEQGYTIPEDILQWPGNAPADCHNEMAPYVDVDGNGTYDPTKGDYPKIKGDVMLWWTFNDLVKHTQSDGQPLKVQINSSCYAYKNITLKPSDTNYIINRSLFFDFKVINLGTETLEDVRVGIFQDPDIGNRLDDAATVDSLANLVYVFNSDNYDERSNGFGLNPPMYACKFLNQKLESFNTMSSGQFYSYYSKDFYALMRNGWYQDTQFIEFSSKIPNNSKPCQYVYSGIPTDRRFLMVTSGSDMAASTSNSLELVFMLFNEPGVNYLTEKCDDALLQSNKVQSWYNNSSFPSKPYWTSDIESIELSKIILYPNPATETIQIMSQNESINHIEVYDVSGKSICQKSVNDQSIKLSVTDWAKGIYIIRIESVSGVEYKKIIVE